MNWPNWPPNFLPQHFPTKSIPTARKRTRKGKEWWVGLKMDLKNDEAFFLSVNSFQPKLKRHLLDLSVLYLCVGTDWIQKIPQPHTIHNNKETWRRATYPMASAAAHDPPVSVPALCACLPHHGQCRARSVFFILRWGVSCVTFFISAF